MKQEDFLYLHHLSKQRTHSLIELVIWLNFIDELEIIAMAKSRDNQQR